MLLLFSVSVLLELMFNNILITFSVLLFIIMVLLFVTILCFPVKN